MDIAIRELLIRYAERFETPSFIINDPSWFMHQVDGCNNQEIMAFIASCLSYGSRKQFMPKIQFLLHASKGEPFEWVRSGAFENDVPDRPECFYRLYSYHTMNQFLHALRRLIITFGSLSAFAACKSLSLDGRGGNAINVLNALADWFYDSGLQGIVPKPHTSLCKRPCMFMRWMVRDLSPVDLGLWADYVNKASLFVPLDTHVMQTACRLGLLNSMNATWKTVERLTLEMGKVFPGDPARGDYALYGADLPENY